MNLTISSNPWKLPDVPIYLEGRPSNKKLERDRRESAAARAAWSPSREAFELLDQLRPFVGSKVLIQCWDPIMFLLEEEGPYPIRATCMNVITRKDDAGFLRAYLVLQDPKSVPTRDEYDSIGSLASDGEYFLLGIDSSIRLSRRST